MPGDDLRRNEGPAVRLRRLGASAVIGLFALTACGSGDSGVLAPTPKPSGPTTFSVKKIDGLDSGSELKPPRTTSFAETSWSKPRYTTQRPDVSGYDTLNAAVEKQVRSWTETYTKDMATASQSDLTVTWETAAAAGGILGIRLISHTTAADAALESVTIYGDVEATWTSADLIRPDKRNDLIKRLAKELKADTPPDLAEAARTALTDITFQPDGSMVVRVDQGALLPYSEGAYSVTIQNPQQYLSDDGVRVMRATMDTTTQPTLPPVTTSAAVAPHVDCTKTKCIALTFDDGPGPYTSTVLDTLEKNNAKATFFVLGPSVQGNPELVRRIASLGMDIGNHTWSHSQLTLLAPETVTDEINRTSAAIKAAAGVDPVAVRPPYGDFNASTAHGGLPFVLWNDDTLDWKNRDAKQTTKLALDQAKDGGIILMHDIHASTAAALPDIIAGLKQRGYTLVTVSDLLGKMDPKKAYFSRTDVR